MSPDDHVGVSRTGEPDRDDSMAVRCGRCGRSLIVRLEEIKGKYTIDCEACETKQPENELLVNRSSPLSSRRRS
jgi:DNA-directed RNA polymerase subunit RPC12/RpoP